MKRRILTFLLAALMLTTLFGCKSKKDHESPKTVSDIILSAGEDSKIEVTLEEKLSF